MRLPLRASPSLVLAILFALLPFAAEEAADATDASTLQLEGGPFVAYRINRARLVSATGIEGRVRVTGRLWDGGQVELFASDSVARSSGMDLAFYCDETLRSLDISVSSTFGSRQLQYDLSTLDDPDPRLRSLYPPVPLGPGTGSRPQLDLQSSSLEGAGRMAVDAFSRPASRAAWLCLLCCVLAGGLAAALPRSEGRRRPIGLILPGAAALGSVLLLAFLATLPPTLFVAVFPLAPGSSQFSGVLDRRVESAPGYQIVRYAPGQSEGNSAGGGTRDLADTIELIGIAAKPEQGIPLDDLEALAGLGGNANASGGGGAGPGGNANASGGGGGRAGAEAPLPDYRLRFSAAPRLSLSGGRLLVGADRLLTGWMIHEN